ncbi:MAG: methylated-DNA--[protein]-cysteine S-methyltransferase [Bacteroidota bacterium]
MPSISATKFEEYYQALLDRNPSYVGIFYAGVKTTSVFCIATCRARKPKKKNVVFYKTLSEALQNGFRPCKICNPTKNANESPEQVTRAIELVKQNPKEKVSDAQLRALQISPDILRRWFKKNYGITFQAYQRMYRINNAYKELKDGKTTTATAFDAGYESLSGFGYTYKKVLGQSPSQNSKQNILLINRLSTPLGPMFVCASDQGICLLEFTDRRMLETEFRDLQKRLKASILIGENDHTLQLKKELQEYFEGKRTQFESTLHTPGTNFQNTVWKALQQVPFGETATYQQQAYIIHRPKAVRAVARANGFNRIAIVIPCHRIVRSNGELAGYGGGVERKRWLIDFERRIRQRPS